MVNIIILIFYHYLKGMLTMNKILIISAHPDDDILGCGGMMSKFSEKKQIRVIFIADGSSCRYKKEQLNTKNVKAKIEQRNRYGVEALKSLGINSYVFNLPCGRLDQIPIIDINKIIEKEIFDFKPDCVFTHANSDTNNDHFIINKSTLIATRPGSRYLVKELYSYEVLSSSEWKFTDNFKPNYFISLTKEDIEKKWKALKKYKSEIKDFPYPRSYEGLIALAKYRGMQSNSCYAEAYRLIRKFV